LNPFASVCEQWQDRIYLAALAPAPQSAAFIRREKRSRIGTENPHAVSTAFGLKGLIEEQPIAIAPFS
jgi:hypothetical protein